MHLVRTTSVNCHSKKTLNAVASGMAKSLQSIQMARQFMLTLMNRVILIQHYKKSLQEQY